MPPEPEVTLSPQSPRERLHVVVQQQTLRRPLRLPPYLHTQVCPHTCEHELTQRHTKKTAGSGLTMHTPVFTPSTAGAVYAAFTLAMQGGGGGEGAGSTHMLNSP